MPRPKKIIISDADKDTGMNVEINVDVPKKQKATKVAAIIKTDKPLEMEKATNGDDENVVTRVRRPRKNEQSSTSTRTLRTRKAPLQEDNDEEKEEEEDGDDGKKIKNKRPNNKINKTKKLDTEEGDNPEQSDRKQKPVKSDKKEKLEKIVDKKKKTDKIVKPLENVQKPKKSIEMEKPDQVADEEDKNEREREIEKKTKKTKKANEKQIINEATNKEEEENVGKANKKVKTTTKKETVKRSIEKEQTDQKDDVEKPIKKGKTEKVAVKKTVKATKANEESEETKDTKRNVNVTVRKKRKADMELEQNDNNTDQQQNVADDDKSDAAVATVAAAADDQVVDDVKTTSPIPIKRAKKTTKSTTKEPVAEKLNKCTTNYDECPLIDPTKKWTVKISSWNVAGLRALTKKGGMDFIKHERPDILCMQEIKCTDDEVPEEAKIKGYHTYWKSTPGGHSGVALYSKVMPYNVEYGIGDDEQDQQGRIITAEYLKYFIVCVYVPNAGNKLVNLNKRMRWDKLFQEHLIKLNNRKPVIVCGDLNVAHNEIDLANPKTNKRSAGFTQEERDGMTELLSLGFMDTFRELYPDRRNAYTYWTYMANARQKNVGWRLDYFLTSARIYPKVVDNVIRSNVYGSDHCPITLFINI